MPEWILPAYFIGASCWGLSTFLCFATVEALGEPTQGLARFFLCTPIWPLPLLVLLYRMAFYIYRCAFPKRGRR